MGSKASQCSAGGILFLSRLPELCSPDSDTSGSYLTQTEPATSALLPRENAAQVAGGFDALRL